MTEELVRNDFSVGAEEDTAAAGAEQSAESKTGEPMIEVVNLTKKFGDLLVLDDISESVYAGEKVVVIGPSGGGKSTFLRCLNCLEDPTSGQIFFEGVDLADLKVNINESTSTSTAGKWAWCSSSSTCSTTLRSRRTSPSRP